MKFAASNIKTRIIIMLFLIVFIVFSSVTFITLKSVHDIVLNDTQSSGKELVKNSADGFSQLFNIRIAELNTIANNEVFQKSDLDAQIAYLGEFMQNKEYINNYEMLLYADVNGDCKTNNGSKISTTNIKDRPYFKAVMQGKDFVISDPVISKVSQKLVVVVAYGIKKDGKTIGMIAGTITGDSLIDMVSNIKSGEKSYAYVVQKDGLVIIHTNKDAVRQLNIANNDYYLDAGKTIKPSLTASDSLLKAGINIVSKESGVEKYYWEGEDQIAIYQTIPNTEWRLVLAMTEKEMFGATNNLISKNVILFLVGMLIFVGALYVMISNVLNPLSKITKTLQVFSKGDISVDAPSELIKGSDEISIMTSSLVEMQQFLRTIIQTIQTSANQLNQSSTGLLVVSENMATSSEQTSKKTNEVSGTLQSITKEIVTTSDVVHKFSDDLASIAAASQEFTATIESLAIASNMTLTGVGHASNSVVEMADSIHNVSDSTTDVVNSVNHLAKAVKEINMSLNEISSNCRRSIQITGNAEMNVEKTNTVISKLKISSNHIGKMVSLIDNIANQTNMLALNAAIEAAGAGEAGKGFSVVAREVKELAKQTTEATEKISQQINSMQDDMAVAVSTVDVFLNVIAEMSSITNTIASAVTQQTAIVGAISNTVVSAVSDVNRISDEIGSIAKNSQVVSKSVNDASEGVRDVAKSASELSLASNDISQSTENICGKIETLVSTIDTISTGSNSIDKRVAEIKEDTGNIAVKSKDTRLAAEALTYLAKELEDMVKRFRL